MNPSGSGTSIVWRHPWPPDIIKALILDINPEGTLENSDLKLATLVLHKDTLMDTCSEETMAAPQSGSDNTPTVSWSTSEESTINPVVTEIFSIHALHSRQFFLNPSVFYHPGLENCIADDASCLFDLSDTTFLAYMYVTYQKPRILWKLCPLPSQLISCIISMMLRKPCNQGLHRTRADRDSTGSGPISAPPCRLDLLSKIHPSLKWKYCRYMETGSNTPSTPSANWTDLGKSRFLRHGGKLWQPTSWMASPTQEILPTPRPTPEWKDVSPGSSKPTAWRTLLPNKKRPPH